MRASRRRPIYLVVSNHDLFEDVVQGVCFTQEDPEPGKHGVLEVVWTCRVYLRRTPRSIPSMVLRPRMELNLSKFRLRRRCGKYLFGRRPSRRKLTIYSAGHNTTQPLDTFPRHILSRFGVTLMFTSPLYFFVLAITFLRPGQMSFEQPETAELRRANLVVGIVMLLMGTALLYLAIWVALRYLGMRRTYRQRFG